MDPAVTAAIIAVPSAVVAAAAAYAAGRAQARGAHRGPVDAVRRQHQRDAYAAFFAALLAYEAATKWDTCRDRALSDAFASSAGPTVTADEVVERAAQLILNVSLDELMRTGAAVDLEGPDRVAAAATITLGIAREIREAALRPNPMTPIPVVVTDANSRLSLAISGFVKAARAHLNGAGG
jgi:hypothetical protein